MVILAVVPNSMWAWVVLWLDLSYASILLEAQSGLMKGDYSVIDYSMQCGSFDVWVSLMAACSSATSLVVSALAVAAFPFPSCGLALSAELRLYPVFCFQPWNVDYVIGNLSPDMEFAGCSFAFSWTLDKTCVDDLVYGSDSCGCPLPPSSPLEVPHPAWLERWIRFEQSLAKEAREWEWVQIEKDEKEELEIVVNSKPKTEHVTNLAMLARLHGLEEENLMFWVFEYGEEEGTHAVDR